MPSRFAFLDTILNKEGAPYIWAAKGPDTFDCSGLVTWGIQEVGGEDLRPYHNAARLFAELEPTDQPEPGDLCFYGPPGRINHVMVFVGDGRVYGAAGGNSSTKTPTKGAKVQFRPKVRYRPDFRGYRRLPF